MELMNKVLGEDNVTCIVPGADSISVTVLTECRVDDSVTLIICTPLPHMMLQMFKWIRQTM